MQNLILLHGALGASSQFKSLVELLSQHYNVHTVDFSGHGGEPFPSEPFTIPMFANEILAFMKGKEMTQAHFFGYSMGGYVAMYLARHYSENIGKLITLATKYHWDEGTAAKEIQMIDPDKLLDKVPAFAETLQVRHAPNDWKELLSRTACLLESLGKQNTLQTEDYHHIANPCLILLGDRDKMITLEETVAVYKLLPNGRMGMLPGTPHPIEQVNHNVLKEMLLDFLQ
jgi:pimeloyl-ACP methyl ester carboxylesterase